MSLKATIVNIDKAPELAFDGAGPYEGYYKLLSPAEPRMVLVGLVIGFFREPTNGLRARCRNAGFRAADSAPGARPLQSSRQSSPLGR